MTDYEILEHTADIGIRAYGINLTELFETATRGLCSITGAWRAGDGQTVAIEVGPGDLGAVLVDWLSEVLYLQDAWDSIIAAVTVDGVSEEGARGKVVLAPRGDETLEGTAVKAITYHQLRVEHVDGRWIAEVYLDV